MIERIVSPTHEMGSRLSRFALVGGLATAVDIGSAVALAEAGVARYLADLVALLVAALLSFALHHRVTLRGDNLDRWIRRSVVFAAVALAAGAIDFVIFVSLTGVGSLLAKVIAVAAAAVVRVAAHRAVLFRAVRHDQGTPSNRAQAPGSFRLSVVVPAYCEGQRISDTIKTIRSDLGPLVGAGELEIVVVDDGSTDDTAEVAELAGADQVVVQPQNRGKGAAVRVGISASNGRAVAYTDADLAYPPRQLFGFLEVVEQGWDAVIGNRHHEATVTITETSKLRSIGSRSVNAATSLLLLGNYRDTQCGCKAFRSDVARIVTQRGIIDGFAFDIEILHLIERHGLSLRELPVEVANSDSSTVSVIRDGLRVGRDILRIRRRSRSGGYRALDPDELPSAGSAVSGASGRSDGS